MTQTHPVLVVGAGPTGLTAANELLRHGVPVRVVDRASGASPLTKALMVWPRTLEILSQLGGDDYLASHGQVIDAFRYNAGGRPICTLRFSGETQPSVVVQPDVEELLTHSLQAAGGHVEWQTALVSLQQDVDGVDVTLRSGSGAETTQRFAYVIGADGASSSVRKQLDIEFTGSTYANLFILADTAVDGDIQRDAVHYYLSPNGILVMVPLYNGRFRAFTAAPPDMDPASLTDALLQDFIDKRGPGGLRLHDVSWRTTFSIHARHAASFRSGRVFLAGDAGHVHSPAGGQGLNTGVTDAHNLAWKVALTHRGLTSPALLDSYDLERKAVAAGVVRQAELQTKAWMLSSPWQRRARDLAVRASERLGLFDRLYNPWLAGTDNIYPEGPGAVAASAQRRLVVARQRPRVGRLVPELCVRTDDTASGAGAEVLLRSVLPLDRYSLVLLGDHAADRFGAGSNRITARHPELVTEIWVSSDGLVSGDELRAPTGRTPDSGPRRTGGVKALLVRPDHYIAAIDDSADLRQISALLAALTGQGPASVAGGAIASTDTVTTPMTAVAEEVGS